MGTNSQTVAQSVNKKIYIGFSVATTDATSTNVVTAATIVAAGAKVIRSIHLKCTGGDGYLGLAETATTTPGTDIIPIFQNVFLNEEDCAYTSLNVIRSSGNVTVTGYVVVN